MFVFFAAFAFISLPKVDASVETTVVEKTAISAKELYTRNCANCHGADGKGQTALGRSKDVPDLTDVKPSLKKSIRVITNGDGDMPAFGKKLKKTEINAIANYLRSL
jgi:mono/diheme cytochrome c family protein